VEQRPSIRVRSIATPILAAVLIMAGAATVRAQVNEVIVHPKARKPQVATPKKPPADAPRFEQEARINISQGLIRQVAWLSDNSFITLVMRPDGAQVLRYDYDSLRREKFLSADFINKYLSGAAQADSLTWTISPGRKYIFFNWTVDDGHRRWKLLDISDPPNFKLRNFAAPEGMQIDRALFSPDDHYVAFFHDSNIQGSPVSILILDLQGGKELWRIGSAELGFIKDAWWDGAVYDAPKFEVTAMVHNGDFLKRAGLATLSLTDKKLDFSDNVDGVVTGASGLWGQVLALQNTENTQSPYFMVVNKPSGRDTLPLTSVPDSIQPLSASGLLLLNNLDRKNNVGELWLIDTNARTKYLVDGDVAGYALSGGGRLIVRGEQSNELRIYDFINPKAAPTGTNAAADRGLGSAPGGQRDPDAWVPH